MEESLEQKKRRLFGKQYLKSYEDELKKVVTIPINSDGFLSIAETDNIRLQENDEKISFRFEFSDKNSLSSIINKIYNYDREECYLYIGSYSEDCGLYRLNSIKDFNVGFSLTEISSGIIIIYSIHKGCKILFDFYEEQGVERMEVEVYGQKWLDLFTE